MKPPPLAALKSPWGMEEEEDDDDEDEEKVIELLPKEPTATAVMGGTLIVEMARFVEGWRGRKMGRRDEDLNIRHPIYSWCTQAE